MAELFQFPHVELREWSSIERTLRDLLRDAGFALDAAEWILNDLKPRWLRAREAANFDPSYGELAPCCREAVRDMAEEIKTRFHAYGHTLFLEVFRLECELAAMRFP